MNFENWVNGVVSKNRRHFRNKSPSILMLSKNVNNKKRAPKLIFFNEKKIEKDSDNFWYRKLTLKVKRLGDFALFDTSPLTQFSKFNHFLWVCWFLGKNLSNFVPPAWKPHNPYCHNGHLSGKLSIFLRGYYERRGRSSSVRDCRRSSNLHSNTSCAMYVQLHATTSPPPSASWPRSSGALRNVRSAQFGSGL